MVKNDRTQGNESEANRSHSVGANDVCCANNGWRGHARSLVADYRFPIDNLGNGSHSSRNSSNI